MRLYVCVLVLLSSYAMASVELKLCKKDDGKIIAFAVHESTCVVKEVNNFGKIVSPKISVKDCRSFFSVYESAGKCD